jgi:hypothetical protein
MDNYFLETDIAFPVELMDAARDIALNYPEKLIPRDRVWRKIYAGMPQSEMIELLGVRNAREILTRFEKMDRAFPGGKQINFDQFSLPDELQQAFIDACPSWMQDIKGREELIPIIQISTHGNILYPHRGHFRNASIFCLLENSDERTRWWKETSPMKIIPDYKIPDVSKLELAYEITIKNRIWSVFNHAEWHSVHSDSNFKKRINVGIDFATLTVDDFLPILTSNSKVLVPASQLTK